MDALLQDLRYALRHIRQSPWFAAAAVATLALGIGANTAMFTMVNALLLKPLEIRDPDGLIALTGRNQFDQIRQTLVSVIPELEKAGPLETPCALNGNGVFGADVGGTPTQSVIALVTGRCFETFGVAPLLGRTLTPEDVPIDGPGARVTVIGHRFWSRMFGQDPNVLGRTIRMEGIELAVVGVMPEGFMGIQADFGIDVWLPVYTISPRRPERPSAATQILGRLKPGVSFEQAQAELTARWPALMQAIVPTGLPALERDTFATTRVRVERMGTGVSYFRDRFAEPVVVVWGLTGVLLVLACINLGGLLIARLAGRATELGIRLALGGSRRRIAQQMLLESLLLSLSGAALAIPAALAFVRLLESFLPPGAVNRAVAMRPDVTVLAATAAIGVLAGLVMSSLSVWLAWRRQSSQLTLNWDRTIVGQTGRWTRGLLAAQVALSLVLLSGAGLLARSLYALQHASLGLRADGVLNLRVFPVPDGYRGMDGPSYYRAMYDQLQAVPGVRSVGFARSFPRPATTVSLGQPIARVGAPPGELRATLETASPGFFETIGIPLLRGRYPAWSDTTTTPQVAVISESLARGLNPDGNVLGWRVRFGTNRNDQDVEIVGVVANASMGNPRDTAPLIFYRPMLQAGAFAYYPNIVIAAEGDPMRLTSDVARVISAGGREFVNRAQPLEQIFLEAPSAERMTATVSGGIAGLAVILAFLGLYSLLAYSVSRRTREIGVRVALGAGHRDVIRMVMRDGALLTVIGVLAGVPMVLASSGVLQTLLFGVSGTDPIVLSASIAFFLALGLAAGILPARRAASVDPAIALRNE